MKLFTRSLALLLTLGAAAASLAQSLNWIGNTKLNLTGVANLPTKGAFVQPWQSVSVTTQTWPISSGQSVFLIYTTDNWQSTTTIPMSFDQNVGNNSQWFAVLGPMPANSDVQFYLRAQSTGGATLYDSNSSQNFGVLTRYAPAIRQRAILQWFATDYRTILKRLPEVAAAGYGALWLPPPQKSGGGSFSVGYNPFDRFDLGDRMQLGTVKTRYGSTQELQDLIRLAHRFGLEVYVDAVFNHNDNRASSDIRRYPGMIPEDFHIRSSVDATNSEMDLNNATPFSFNTLNNDLVGLADIAHEDGNQSETGPFNLPSYASFNSQGKPTFVRDPATPVYYPGGQTVPEDVRQYLGRWGWFLTSVLGLDGLRLDAVRHTAPSFFNRVQTQPGPTSSALGLMKTLFSLNPNVNLFGEDLTSDSWEQREYLKTGTSLLDFPLKFTLDSLLNSNGFGDISAALSNGYGLDANGMPFQNGGLSPDVGVSFLQSHDQGPPTSNNLGYAFILTRPGSAVVYFDGNNLNPNDWNQFPKPGRFDALGAGGDTILKLVDARARFGRGYLVNRYTTSNAYVYERQVAGQGVMLVGLNLRGDFTALTQTVQTAFAGGTVLQDLSGQQPDVAVQPDSKVTLTIPSNSVPGNSNNARGYVVYAPKTFGGLDAGPIVSMSDAMLGTRMAAGTVSTPAGTYGSPGSYTGTTCRSGVMNFAVRLNQSYRSAVLQIDNGIQLPGAPVLTGTPEGLADGSVAMAAVARGTFQAPKLDLRGLPDGLHMLRVRAFVNTGAAPGAFRDFFVFVNLQKSMLGTMTGDLQGYGSPLTTQTRSASSFSNRLDGLFATNDDQYVYIGVEGSVDSNPSFMNGISVLIDKDPGSGTGVSNLSMVKDDSGPAARLLSNAKISLPNGFGADFGASSLWGSTIHSAPERSVVGDVRLTDPVGAFAGLFRFDVSRLNWLPRESCAMAYLPRTSLASPATGLSIAIPIRTLYPGSVGPNTQFGMIAYLGTTGESGTNLLASDPLRGIVGGRPAPQPWITNQFLPPQNGIVADPGTGNATLTQYVLQNLRFSTDASASVSIAPSAPTVQGSIATQTVLLTNTSASTIAGPIYLVVNTGSVDVVLTDSTGNSLLPPALPYLRIDASIAPGASLPINLTYALANGAIPSPSFSVKAGAGLP